MRIFVASPFRPKFDPLLMVCFVPWDSQVFGFFMLGFAPLNIMPKKVQGALSDAIVVI